MLLNDVVDLKEINYSNTRNKNVYNLDEKMFHVFVVDSVRAVIEDFILKKMDTENPKTDFFNYLEKDLKILGIKKVLFIIT